MTYIEKEVAGVGFKALSLLYRNHPIFSKDEGTVAAVEQFKGLRQDFKQGQYWFRPGKDEEGPQVRNILGAFTEDCGEVLPNFSERCGGRFWLLVPTKDGVITADASPFSMIQRKFVDWYFQAPLFLSNGTAWVCWAKGQEHAIKGMDYMDVGNLQG